MRKRIRIFAAIVSLIGSAILLLMIFWLGFFIVVTDNHDMVLWPFFVFGVGGGAMGVVGGILLIEDKTAGGIVDLISGGLDVILYFCFIYLYNEYYIILPETVLIAGFSAIFPIGMIFIGGYLAVSSESS